MNIEREQINVGAYYVMRVDMRTGGAAIVQYTSSYDNALFYASNKYDATKGYVYLVLEVQGVVQPQGIPDVVTSLTRKL